MIFKRSVYVDFHEQVFILVVIKTHTAEKCMEVPQSRLTKSSDIQVYVYMVAFMGNLSNMNFQSRSC